MQSPRGIITPVQRMKADLIIHNAGQLITCASGDRPKRGGDMLDIGLIRTGAVAIADGKFVGAGRSDEILKEFDTEEIIDAAGRVLCPGFVDPHTHIVYAGDRLDEFELKVKGAAYLDILAAGGGIISTVERTRDASVDELVSLGLLRLDKMLACGTTTCEIKTGYGLDTETELKMLSVVEELDSRHPVTIVPTFLAAHAVPPAYKDDPDRYVEEICDEMLRAAWEWYLSSRFRRNVIPFFCDVFCETGAFTVERSRRVLGSARSLGFLVKAHVEQFNDLGGTMMALDLDATSVDHLDAISDEATSRLASSNTIGVVIPTENFNAGRPTFAPAREMIDKGCVIALSTDFNPGSAPCPSIPMAMAIAARYQKLLPAECLNAATINAAHAIAMGDRVGSIEVGKQADFLILDTGDYRQLAYEFGGNLVSRVFKAGREVL